MNQPSVSPSAFFRRPLSPQHARRPAVTPSRTQLRSRLQSTPVPARTLPGAARAEIRSMVFCASIHDRPDWAPVVPLLLAKRSAPRWDKARLSSHDLAVHMAAAAAREGSGSGSGEGSTPSGSTPDTPGILRFLLVSPADVGQAETTRRLQRLAQGKRGTGSAVLFLLSRGGGDGHGDGWAAYQQIQLDLRDTRLSILPLTSVETLPATVAAFCGQFTMPQTAGQDSGDARLHSLLRMCLGGPVPLSSEAARKLIAAAEGARAASSDEPGVALGDVVRFCADLKERRPHQLEAILGVNASPHGERLEQNRYR